MAQGKKLFDSLLVWELMDLSPSSRRQQGFFRRSIQQNIQYKKCLKSESCAIMRINRNRCQQCRFKKCLMRSASGASPSGRSSACCWEMQSAMNNMMNSSQLQAPPADQPLSAAAPAQDAGPGPASSPSSQWDSGEAEAALAMDTSPSSSSPSASDSGEEEVIGSVTRAHQETFMYNQEQSSLANEAPPPTGPAHKTQQDQQQNAWNRCNNLVTMAAQEPPSSQGCPRQEDSVQKHRPFRMSRDASHTPTYAHGALRAPPPACPASRGPQWRGGNRMYLEALTGGCAPQVCPMNMSAYVDPQKSGQEVWEEFSHSFTPAVREVVEFAKKIPGFRDLSQHDQVSLLKAGTFEVLVVRFASLFDVQNRTVTFLGGRKYSMDALRAMGAGDLLNSMFDFSEKLMSLGLSEEEMSLFTAVVLVSAGEPRPCGGRRAGSAHQTNRCASSPRSLGHRERELGGGPAGDADPGPAQPDHQEPPQRVGHLHQAAAQAARPALAQQHALGAAARLQGPFLNAAASPGRLPFPGPSSETAAELRRDEDQTVVGLWPLGSEVRSQSKNQLFMSKSGTNSSICIHWISSSRLRLQKLRVVP
ncbi:unnamed protein product [Tetraodon nigroviridis]|uniref:(spotted green pufferfish) hypothetical protein n=1 Tax=Tetraodon nigroviridis TaxID=99883 RepID=Q4SGI2_TETNG|nr:unnamed protein product [Tetraodon nigroviridis]